MATAGACGAAGGSYRGRAGTAWAMPIASTNHAMQEPRTRVIAILQPWGTIPMARWKRVPRGLFHFDEARNMKTSAARGGGESGAGQSASCPCVGQRDIQSCCY